MANENKRPSPFVGEEGEMVRNKFVENGYGDTIKTVDAICGVDTAALRGAANETYGVAKQAIADMLMRAVVGSGSDLDGSAVPSVLGNVIGKAEMGYNSVNDNWHGDGEAAARVYKKDLVKVTAIEIYRAAVIGDSIETFADAADKAAEDVEVQMLGAANLLWAQVGLGVSIAGGGVPGILIATAGSVGAISQELMTAEDAKATEASEVADAIVEIENKDSGNKKEIDEKLMSAPPDEMMPEFPDVEDWEIE